MLFAELARRTNAEVVEGFTGPRLREALTRAAGSSRLRRVLGRRPRLASSEMLQRPQVAVATELAEPVAVAIYDDPVVQAAALGVPFASDVAEERIAVRRANMAAFAWHIVPNAAFAELIGLDPARVIVGRNGTDTAHIRPEPWPNRPAVGFISGAAPSRGIEALIEAGRILRGRVPDLRVLLWLAGTSEGSRRYLESLQAATAAEPWVRVETAPYAELSVTLGQATVMCIPHPANVYFDVMLPVKLLDSMAAGRPVVVTPRTEMAGIVRDANCGLVTVGDTPEDLADGIGRLLDDEALARRLAAAGRAAAERDFEWTVISGRVAEEVLRRV